HRAALPDVIALVGDAVAVVVAAVAHLRGTGIGGGVGVVAVGPEYAALPVAVAVVVDARHAGVALARAPALAGLGRLPHAATVGVGHTPAHLPGPRALRAARKAGRRRTLAIHVFVAHVRGVLIGSEPGVLA